MMDTSFSSWKKRIFEGWADYFKCSSDVFFTKGTLLIPKESIRGMGYIHAWYVGSQAVLHADPLLMEMLEEKLDLREIATFEIIQSLLQEEQVHLEHTEVVYYLYPGDFKPATVDATYLIRQMTIEDQPCLDQLSSACTQEELEDAWIEIDQPLIFGCFYQEQLVSVASISESWAKLVDIGVLTHPEFRRQGLGKAVVSQICEKEIEKDRILQYRSVMELTGSHAIAKALGFNKYFDLASIKVG